MVVGFEKYIVTNNKRHNSKNLKTNSKKKHRINIYSISISILRLLLKNKEMIGKIEDGSSPAGDFFVWSFNEAKEPIE